MNPWHTLTDSDAFRRFTKRGPGRVVFRSQAFRRAKLARDRALSRHVLRRQPGLFDGVRTYCVFVGHNKSGTSMLGGLLDAHPNVVLSDECDALRYVDAGFHRDQIFYLLLRGARAEARKGRVTARRLQPYSYAVPGQWQGSVQRPLVVGDGTTGTTTRRLGANPDLLDRLLALIDGVDVRLIQVIRNPFDPIAAMMVRGHRTFRNAIDHYFTACRTLIEIRERVDAEKLLPVRYEAFASDPVHGLSTVCSFLGVEADPGYLEACAGIIRRRPDRTRGMVEWTDRWIDEVERRMSEFAFLRGYAYVS